MSTKALPLGVLILVFGATAHAAIHWTAGGNNRLWDNPNNWEGKKVPSAGDEVYIDVPPAAAPNGPILQEGITAKILGLACEVAGEPTMKMTGGTLEITDWIWWGDGADCHGTFEMSGGTITVVNEHELGWGGGSGTWIMTGGTVSAGRLVIPTATGKEGQLYLHGGTFNVGSAGLSMTATGLIDITEGTLTLQGDKRTVIQGFIDNKQITAYAGAGYFDLDYNVRSPGLTTVIAIPGGPKANRPDPADGARAVLVPLFRWGTGQKAVLHDVYVGTSPDALVFMGRQPTAVYWHLPGLIPGTTYYWRVDEVEADGKTIHTGDVWTFTAQALMAYYPNPADGAAGVSSTPVLTWLPGQSATKHHVYLADNAEAVTQGAADTDKGEVTDPTFTPGALESLTIYFWRVDETILGGTLKTGPVWKFSTCLPVDDFESYADELGTAVFDTWIDGVTTGLTGSTVGYGDAPFTEKTIVHGGLQSMPLDYNNTKSPYYSEAEREFAPVQDWTVNNADALLLDVRGRIANAAAPLYVAVEDASKKVAVVVCPDAAAVTTAKWTEWKIPLSSLTGVNLAKVKKLYLGVGDRQNPAAGGTGRLFIDDIRVARP